MSWSQWAAGVLNGVGAPVDQTNLDTLWAWSNAESGADVMRWNNPLNTTQPWLGALDQNSVGVKYYLTLGDGISATIVTLGNGYYPRILAHLRASVPRWDWPDACAELGKWGTGCGWLNIAYGAAPGVLEADMTPEQEKKLDGIRQAVDDLNGALFYPLSDPLYGNFAKLFEDKIRAIVAAELAARPAGGGPEPSKFSGTIEGVLS